ncbi:acyltransferase family protein [Cupriavidus metallidurans]|uniref:acyltransferase family protein n=1 Tax=Cupriavidus metallidurans TaxID=119219 RepID=UPI0004650602|nr:acyltransferase [Cupriavidus metallidurans]
MDLYSIWPSAAVIALCLALVWPKRLWRFLDDPPSGQGQRYVTVDGLRGFLALAVVLHHSVISYGFHQTGEWKLPPSSFYSIIGQVGVSIFFMITAFLFWGRLLDQGKRLDWFALYVNRFLRIAPLYWVVVALMLLVVAIKTGFTLAVPPSELVKQVFQWALPAIVRGMPPVNGYQQTFTITAGGTWTLYYEWMFYFSLPFLAIAAIKRSPLAFVPACIWIVFVMPETLSSAFARNLVAMFVMGMVAASLVRRSPGFRGDSVLKSAIAVALLAFPLLTRSTAYEWVSILSLGAFFILVSSGASLFGLLASRSAVRLGSVSYGIYLLQGIVITVLHSPRVLGAFASKGPEQFWLTTIAVGLVLVCVAAASYHFVERPCIRLGKKIGKAPESARQTHVEMGDGTPSDKARC